MSLTDEVKSALASLRHSLEADRLAHAYLVVGMPRGNAGQLAEAALSLLYCVSPNTRPCGECAGCRRAADHTHPDLLWVEPQKKSRTIQMDQIQQVQQHIFQTSFEGGWKSVVLVHAERLSEVAANKLLKTLEEPPARCLFLLLTDNPEFLLPTIVSRCQRIVISGFSPEEDAALKSAVVDIVTGGQGEGVVAGMARARWMLDLLKAIRKQVEAEEEESAEMEILGKMGKSSESDQEAGEDRIDMDPGMREEMEKAVEARIEGRYRERRTSVLRWLLFWYRDILLCVCGLGQEVYYFPEETPRIQKVALGLTCRRALDNIRIVEDMKDQLEQYLAESMVLEQGFVRLTACRA